MKFAEKIRILRIQQGKPSRLLRTGSMYPCAPMFPMSRKDGTHGTGRSTTEWQRISEWRKII